MLGDASAMQENPEQMIALVSGRRSARVALSEPERSRISGLSQDEDSAVKANPDQTIGEVLMKTGQRAVPLETENKDLVPSRHRSRSGMPTKVNPDQKIAGISGRARAQAAAMRKRGAALGRRSGSTPTNRDKKEPISDPSISRGLDGERISAEVVKRSGSSRSLQKAIHRLNVRSEKDESLLSNRGWSTNESHTSHPYTRNPPHPTRTD